MLSNEAKKYFPLVVKIYIQWIKWIFESQTTEEILFKNEYDQNGDEKTASNIAYPIIYLPIKFISKCKTINCTTANLFHVHIWTYDHSNSSVPDLTRDNLIHRYFLHAHL